jgi:predicted transcriptional regulator of viral defense system
MQFQEFQRAFASYPVIHQSEVELVFPGYDRNALTRWQKKGYLIKLRNGLYRLTDLRIQGDQDLFCIANALCEPSYVSVESALSWYGIIPEGVFSVISITTRKTQQYSTEIGHFEYRQLKPGRFFGYSIDTSGSVPFKIAEIEKAILDLLHFAPLLGTTEAFDGLRMHLPELQGRLHVQILMEYASRFRSQALSRRFRKLMQYLNDHG